MDSEHERYETLAVGHVLGGLPAEDAADFRGHLLSCRDCRLRVAELRDIAADLAAAEREERVAARVRTEVAQRTVETEDESPEHDEPRRTPLGSRQLALGTLAVVVVLGAVAFWNLHLRTQVAVTTTIAERLDRTVAGFVDGVPVAAELAEGTRGLVVVDGERVTFGFVDLPIAAPPERVVVWLAGTPEGDVPVVLAGDDGTVSGTIDDEDATELIVTVEELGGQVTEPGDRELARATLDRPADGG